MTTDWSAAASQLPIAPWRMTKYFGLAGHAFALGAFCLGSTPRRWILGLAGLLPMLCVGADAAGVLASPALMSAAFALFWVALLVAGVVQALRPKAGPA